MTRDSARHLARERLYSRVDAAMSDYRAAIAAAQAEYSLGNLSRASFEEALSREWMDCFQRVFEANVAYYRDITQRM